MTKERIQKLKDLIKVQTTDGNWDYDPYMHGLANGLIISLSVIENTDNPPLLDAPKSWACNSPEGKDAHHPLIGD